MDCPARLAYIDSTPFIKLKKRKSKKKIKSKPIQKFIPIKGTDQPETKSDEILNQKQPCETYENSSQTDPIPKTVDIATDPIVHANQILHLSDVLKILKHCDEYAEKSSFNPSQYKYSQPQYHKYIERLLKIFCKVEFLDFNKTFNSIKVPDP
jgi:hypothetical protein